MNLHLPPLPSLLGLAMVLGGLTACGLPPAGDIDRSAAFATDRLVTWEMAFSQADWDGLYPLTDVYQPVDVVIDGALHERLGVRGTGNTNRAKLGMRVRFNEFHASARFHGLKRVNLRPASGDPSLAREALALGLMREAGVPAPRSSFVWVDWGLGYGVYTLVEQVDKRFLEERFGEDEGDLYKLERGANLVYRGDEPSAYDWLGTYQLKTNEETADPRALIGLMKALATDDPAARERELAEVLDVEGLLRLVAVMTWLADLDSLLGTADNLFLYRDQRGRFRAIPWDMNRAFGNYHSRHLRRAAAEDACRAASLAFCARTGCASAGLYGDKLTKLCATHHGEFCTMTSATEQERARCAAEAPELCTYTTDGLLELDFDAQPCNQDRPLVTQVLAVPAYRARYLEILAELQADVLSPASVEARLEAMHALLAERALEDTWKDVSTNADFGNAFHEDVVIDPEADPQEMIDERVPGLAPFIRARDVKLRELLGGTLE
ncbi:MAG TPA: CotH kinase family protein [Myxococcota bacterium]|nr:CotH kinase family protein [Myxococcota bacterium]HRY96501.1 CotH kinase family protein [Myxococcota bacterium]HSA21962.1 CotH kinase family protein [Myxococcota bacterium]